MPEVPPPTFLAVGDPVPVFEERPSREFERLVNDDLRDKFAAGPAYKILSRPENLVRWLQILVDIRRSILSQNTHDNAKLRAHPDRPDGGPTPASYAAARQQVDSQKRSRERALRAVIERIGEVRRLIGTEPLTKRSLGIVVNVLVDADSMLRAGEVDDVRFKLAALLKTLQESATEISSEPQERASA